mgnify:CR=1 FL=1
MFQMCPSIMTKNIKEIIDHDFKQYQDFAKILNVNVSYQRYPMYRPLVRNMPNIIHNIMFKHRQQKIAKTMKKKQKAFIKKYKTKKTKTKTKKVKGNNK